MSITPQSRSQSQVVTIFAIGFAIVWNYVTNWFPPTGVKIAELSTTVFARVKIIPANYTFAIWGLIYLGLIAFGWYQLEPRRADNLPLQKTRPWVVLASLLQSAWILLFLYQQMILSSLAMLGIVWALIKCYRNFHSTQKSIVSLYPDWIPRVFSLYLGWITVATIVNIASTFDFYGWQGSPFTPELWTLLMLVITVVLAGLLHWFYADRIFGGVVIWAIGGIIIANSSNVEIVIGGLTAIAGLTICLLSPHSTSS